MESELSKFRHTDVRLYVQKKDKYRLLKLKVWSEKYYIDLRYIFSVLLPFWEKFVQRQSRKMMREGFNVRIATLTGKKSEKILTECLAKDYPSEQNVAIKQSLARELVLQRGIRKELSGDIKTKSSTRKTLLDFDSPEKYVSYYKSRRKQEAKLREKIIDDMKKFRYRGNPFL